ncbi:Early nodulin-like protein 3 [Sesamum alatum]|uniref:Early nodulin-like protein 3 n=1 Tax=Sesamum alatum TaxID=300844 RepID=A0AAE1Y8I9_9LAMI|nr:Early nodulin-like protein 3 [Sesamum alatum]
MAVLGGSMGAVYNVGDSAGWTNTGVDYQGWADAHTFKVGNEIVFTYDNGDNDVVQVSEEDYNACNSDNPIETYKSGNDMLEFADAGTYYFICSYPNKCLNDNQKVKIEVVSSTDTPPSPPLGPSPSPSSGLSPSPPSEPTPSPSSGLSPSPPSGPTSSPPSCPKRKPKSKSKPPAVNDPPASSPSDGVVDTSAASPLSFNKHLAGLLVLASCALALYLH